MVPYTETATYAKHVGSIDLEVANVESRLAALSQERRGTPGVADMRASLKNALKTRLSWRCRLSELSSSYFTLWDLVHLLADAEGTLWTKDEAELWNLELVAYEGRGEKSLKARHGLVQGPTIGTCDLAEINEEVKNWQCVLPKDKRGIQSIRVGDVGKRSYGRLQRNIVRTNDNDAMSDEQWDCLACGEVSGGKLYRDLPEQVRAYLQAELAPSKVMASYDAINGASELGYVRIPRVDYDDAWRLSCITQMSPKYDLRVDYVKSRLLKTLNAPTRA